MNKSIQIDLTQGLLQGTKQCPSPNFDERPDPTDLSLIVIHNISLPPGEYGAEWIDKLFTNCLPKDAHPFFAEIHQLRVSSHLLIRRDGEVVQYVPIHKRAWHAGVSQFRGREVCNDFSVGIELEGSDYEAFTDAQYHQLEHVINVLRNAYPSLQDGFITGHQHIAPERKTDPGPRFDWLRLSTALQESLPACSKLIEPMTETSQQTTMIDVLRHGEPEGGRMYRGGATDHPLSELGWQQMWHSIDANLSEEGMIWDRVISSPMLRCREFAEALTAKHRLSLEIHGDFREAGYGAWEGRKAKELEQSDYEAYWSFFDDPVNCRPHQAEPLQHFTDKISRALHDLLAAHSGEHVLLITHLGVVRAMISSILSSSLASQQLIDMPFAGMLRIIQDRKGLRLLFR